MHLNGTTLPIFPPAPSDPTLRPADALLRESTAGQSQYSPTTQHEQIVAAMAKHGYYPSCIDGDEQRGRVVSRPGYQRIKARVAQGLTEAVFVFHSSRLGRDASERLALQRELKKLRVPIFSAQQGELRADLVGGVYALMDEQFSVDLAYKVKNALPSAVKNGMYPARTPLGYKRIWPKDTPYKRKQPGLMVPDEHYAPLVQQVFAQYGQQGWTMRSIVRWLNDQRERYPNPQSPRGVWALERVSHILHNPVYSGVIEWGKTKVGYYDHYEGPVLRSGEGDCGPARHVALIDDALWKAVQMRLQTEDDRRPPRTRRGRTPALLVGFLVCAGCGAPMYLKGTAAGDAHHPAQYICGTRTRGQAGCSEPGCNAARAEEAVLREVARLQPGRPWTAGALEEIAQRDPHAAQRAALEAEIAAARRQVAANVRLHVLLTEGGDLGKETLDAFRREQQELDRRITALQAELDALPRQALDPIGLPEIHARLAAKDLAALLGTAYGNNEREALRQLLGIAIAAARVVERRRGSKNGKNGWVRTEVQWTPTVALLLEHGYLRAAPPAPAPPVPAPLPAAARVQRWRAKRRAEQAARVEARGPDLLSVPAAAQELGLAIEGLRSALKRGTIRATYVEGIPQRTFVHRDEIERYRREYRAKPGRKARGEHDGAA